MKYFCCNERRQGVVSEHPEFNGIDFLEVVDDPAMPNSQRQRTLMIQFINPLTGTLYAKNFEISGGERIRNISVTSVRPDPGGASDVLLLSVAEPGDFSTYTLSLVQDSGHPQPPASFDPLLSSVEFSFKIDCLNDFDCLQQVVCPPEILPVPVINYLAKDYASFRRVMLDRMAVLVPQWQERTPADIGNMLVELLAYVGDYLSYQQDAIATEAYPGTARRRISLRRHARLVDYPMHDGCNARAWVQVQVRNDLTLPEQTQFFTQLVSQPDQTLIPPTSLAYTQALAQGALVFESMEETSLFADHNTLTFYTWGDQECCLPKGATSASLLGKLPNLQVGNVLIFQEVLGPETGVAGDANPAHRWAVRVTSVTANSDPLGGFFHSPPDSTPIEVTDIAWDTADALPFPLCISSRTDVSVALGNIVLVDHGRTVTQGLVYVPPAQAARAQPSTAPCQTSTPVLLPPVFLPQLSSGPLTQVGQIKSITSTSGTSLYAGRQQSQVMRFDPVASATSAMSWDISLAKPAISVTDSSGALWTPERDLLASDAFARDFVAEVDENGLASLRFGDDIYGMRPRADTDLSKLEWQASYRVGNGTAGNIGANTLTRIVSNDSGIIAVNNPLGAQGGIDAETLEHARLSAPVAFNTQERAVTLADYAALAQRYPSVQRAVATYRWTGSWRTIFLSIDRAGGQEVDDDFVAGLRQFMELYRMEGQDIEINAPLYVSLEIGMQVCVKAHYFWSDVEQALLAVFSNRILPNGKQGVFYPDNFTFGQSVYLSPLYEAAQAVPGVSFVEIPTFQRWQQPATDASQSGVLAIQSLEVARLDNDPNFPEHGVFRLQSL